MIRSNSIPVRSQHMTKAALLPAVLLLFAAGSAFGAVQYAITDLGTLGGTYSVANGINNNGQIVGLAFTTGNADGHAFLYSGSTMTDLGTLGGTYSVANGINNNGQVAGAVYPRGGNADGHAFLYSGSGPMQDLGTLYPSYIYSSSEARGINNSGQVVGGSQDGTPYGAFGAFLYSGNGPMIDLGKPVGSNHSVASAINDSGQVVGTAYYDRNAYGEVVSRPFFYGGDGGPMQDLGTLREYNVYSTATGINNSGQVVGSSTTTPNADGSVNSHAFLYSGNGPMHDLGTLYGEYYASSTARGINDRGQVVGSSYSYGKPSSRAFLYTGNGPMKDLNDLVAPSSAWTLTEASAINDKGQIVGGGTNPAGQTHAFVLSPLSTITTTTGAPPNTLSNALKPVNPTVTPPSSNLKRWDGSSWQPVNSWTNSGIDPNQPTVVITHGWYGQITDTNWTASLATALQQQALQQQNGNANILAWDWRDDALSLPGSPDLPQKFDIFTEGLNGAAESARRGGERQGKLLANELQNLHISNDKLQLIGHSNGGAVVGATATELSLGGQKVQRITTLDTPNLSLGELPVAVVWQPLLIDEKLLSTSVNAMKYVKANSASEVEVYYSGLEAGRNAFGFGQVLTAASGSNRFNGLIYPGNITNPEDLEQWDHNRIVKWYAGNANRREPSPGEFVAGIDWSILSPNATTNAWKAGTYAEQSFDSGVFGEFTPTQLQPVTLTKLWWDGFETGSDVVRNWLGQHAEMFMRDAGNAAVKLISGSDGYLYRDVSIPGDASYLTFDLKIETPDAGDFLTVTLGDELIFYKALNAADSDFWTVDPIFIGDFAGQTDTLLFTLNHVGIGTPSLLLDNITFSALPALPGDFNGDNRVDAADYVVWRKTGGTQEEYNVWRTHFGQTVNPTAAADSFNQAIPEPASLALLLLGTTALCMIPRPRLAAKNRC